MCCTMFPPFKGFFTQAEDWQRGQEYHIEKNKLHNRFLHTPGIVFGCLDNLDVLAKKNGTVISVEPGCAIDSEGRELYLPAQKQLKINPQSYRPPKTVYVTIKYNEEEIHDMLQIIRDKALLLKVEIEGSQAREAASLSRKRHVAFGDALHAILARDNNAIMVTRDKHFLELNDIAEIRKPEELI